MAKRVVSNVVSKKFKAEDLYTPSFITEFNQLCLDYEINIFVIYYLLNAEVTPGLPWSTYPSVKQSFIEQELIPVYIAYENYDKSGIVSKFYVKNVIIPIKFLEVLFMLLPKYNAIDTLKLEYCNLTVHEIEFLQTILTDFQNIIDLSLDGNPNDRQNFGVVLENTNIKYLSLKRCKISELGMKNICKNLSSTLNDKLLTLNLTGNYIDDNAATHLAKMLRQNRNLRIINLADNWITDLGCCEIMRSLQNFVLTHDEIVIKRKINMIYFMERVELANQFKKQEADIRTQASTESKINLVKSNSLKKSLIQYTSVNPTDETQFIEENITPRTHPFTTDIIEKDNEIHCSGNLQLSYINFSYNKITSTGYQFILETLNYQLTNDYLGTGIVFLEFDGNNDLNCSEFFEIYRILMEKKIKMLSYTGSRSSTILFKRTGSKYSSLINI